MSQITCPKKPKKPIFPTKENAEGNVGVLPVRAGRGEYGGARVKRGEPVHSELGHKKTVASGKV